MSLIGWEDIRLTAEESNAIAMIKAGKDLTGETLSRLHQTANGWAAGLVLLMESLRIKDFDYQLPRGLPREEIFAYFATEVFDKTAAKNQTFLLETSFLPYMNVQMAAELTGNIRAGNIFSNLNRKNYFTNRYSTDEKAFQYHPLFREFLQAKAEATITAGRLQDIRSRCALLLEQNGRGEEALRLFCLAEKWEEVVRVFLTQAPDMISQGRWQTLQGWVASFPSTVTENQPWLLYWKGICRFPTSPEGSMEYFAKAFEQFKSSKDAPGSFLALSGMLDSVNFRLDSFFELDRLVAMMDELREEYPQFPSPEIESHVVNSMLNALTLRQPFNPEWNQWEDRGLALSRYIADVDVAVHILCGLAFYRLFFGEIEKVTPILEAIHQKVDAGHASTLAVLSLGICKPFITGFLPILRRTDGRLMTVLPWPRPLEFTSWIPICSGMHQPALSVSGRLQEPRNTLARCFLQSAQSPACMVNISYHNLKAWQCLLEGRLGQASIHASKGLEFSAGMGGPLMISSPHLINAIIMHQLNDDEKAFVHLSPKSGKLPARQLFPGRFHGFSDSGADLL